MKTFELKTVDQNPEVLKIKNSIQQLKDSIIGMDKNLDDKTVQLESERQEFYQKNVKKELGEITDKEFNDAKKQALQSEVVFNNFVQNQYTIEKKAKAEAIKVLEERLAETEAVAFGELNNKFDSYIEELRLESIEVVEKLKPIIKECHKVIEAKMILGEKHSGKYKSLPVRYDYPFGRLIQIHNSLKTLTMVGSLELTGNGDIVQQVINKLEDIREFRD